MGLSYKMRHETSRAFLRNLLTPCIYAVYTLSHHPWVFREHVPESFQPTTCLSPSRLSKRLGFGSVQVFC